MIKNEILKVKEVVRILMEFYINIKVRRYKNKIKQIKDVYT